MNTQCQATINNNTSQLNQFPNNEENRQNENKNQNNMEQNLRQDIDSIIEMDEKQFQLTKKLFEQNCEMEPENKNFKLSQNQSRKPNNRVQHEHRQHQLLQSNKNRNKHNLCIKQSRHNDKTVIRNKPQRTPLQKIHQNRQSINKKKPIIKEYTNQHTIQKIPQGDTIYDLLGIIFKSFKIFEKHVNNICLPKIKDPILFEKTFNELHFRRGQRKFRDMKIGQFGKHFRSIVQVLQDGREGSYEDRLLKWLKQLLKSDNKKEFLENTSHKQKIHAYRYLLDILQNKDKSNHKKHPNQPHSINSQDTTLSYKPWLLNYMSQNFPQLTMNIFSQRQKNSCQQFQWIQDDNEMQNQINFQVTQQMDEKRKILKKKIQDLVEKEKDKFVWFQKKKYLEMMQVEANVCKKQNVQKDEEVGMKNNKFTILFEDQDQQIFYEEQMNEHKPYYQQQQNQKKGKLNANVSNVKLQQQFNNVEISLKIRQPRCSKKTCKKPMQSRKCLNGNHSIVICSTCGWNQHKCIINDGRLGYRNEQYFQYFQMVAKGQHIKNYNLPRLIPIQQKNNIKSIVKSHGYIYTNFSTIMSSTPRKLTCHYPILPSQARNQIYLNRLQQQYLPLQIKKSSIDGAGLGVFATMPILQSGTLVCSYLGDVGLGSRLPVVKKYKDGFHDNDSIYTLGWIDNQDILIISPDVYGNVGRFINYNSSDKCNLKAGIALIQRQQTLQYEIAVFLSTLRRIEAGEQLFYSYGSDYTN